MENNYTQQNKVKNGRPISVKWRFDENGKLVVEKATFHDYYINNKPKLYSKVQCSICNMVSSLKHLKRHQNSNYCKTFNLNLNSNVNIM